PDLSWNAAVNGGVLACTSSLRNGTRVGWHTYGRTSASSPQGGGLLAPANEQPALAGEPPLCFLWPLRFPVGRGSAFRDGVPFRGLSEPYGMVSRTTLSMKLVSMS